VIEVKAGTDPASVLEHYGAPKISFEEALRINPEVQTILIASCITPEENNHIENDPTIFTYFNLTQILSEILKILVQFIEQVFPVLHK
jgi:hypothetical protein